MLPGHSTNGNDFVGNLKFEPLTRRSWGKFVELFGDRGACADCWCMYYRLARSEFKRGQAGFLNKGRMKRLVWSGKPVGLLAVYLKEAVGWLALAPREDFVKLKSSRVHKPVDNLPVWSITCFFIRRDFRRKGLSEALLNGAIAYARKKRIKVLEAYPVILAKKKWPDSFLWVGLYKSFERVGFEIVDRTSKSRPTVRYSLMKNPRAKRQQRAAGTG